MPSEWIERQRAAVDARWETQQALEAEVRAGALIEVSGLLPGTAQNRLEEIGAPFIGPGHERLGVFWWAGHPDSERAVPGAWIGMAVNQRNGEPVFLIHLMPNVSNQIRMRAFELAAQRPPRRSWKTRGGRVF